VKDRASRCEPPRIRRVNAEGAGHHLKEKHRSQKTGELEKGGKTDVEKCPKS